MESIDKQVNTTAKSGISSANKTQLTNPDYSDELRIWVQLAISEAEEIKDFNKRNRFLNLLNDL
jgi:hypothetical protein